MKFIVFLAICSVCLITNISIASQSDSWERAYEMYKKGEQYSAVQMWKRLAKNGDIDSQIILGKAYFKGSFGSVNKEKSFHYFNKAAIQGNAEAQYFLARLYIELHNDIENARKWLKKSAEQDFSIAVTTLDKLDEMEKNRSKYEDSNDLLSKDGFSLLYENITSGLCKNSSYRNCVESDRGQCIKDINSFYDVCYSEVKSIGLSTATDKESVRKVSGTVGRCIRNRHLQLKNISDETYSECFRKNY